MLWTLLLVAKHPEVQRRAFEEVVRTIGSREPSIDDRPAMPYVESVLNEVLRFANPIPLSPHRVLTPVKMSGGYELPADTLVIGNLYAVLHDPNVWPDADHFNPEANFPLGASVEECERRSSHLISFGVGRRTCIGESLARHQLFLFLVGLLQHFEIGEHPAHPLPSEQLGTNGVTRAPLPYKLRFRRRRD